jgi:hypothetical protein
MAYGAHGGFPAEYASKIGHMKLIGNPSVQRIISAFENIEANMEVVEGLSLRHAELDQPLEQIFTVDGSSVPVPNLQRAEQQLGFIQIAAQLFKLATLQRLSAEPMMDPREYTKLLNQTVDFRGAVLPLAGVHLQGQTVNQSLRELIRTQFQGWGLDLTLKELMYRTWSNSWPPSNGAPHQDCLQCSENVVWDKRGADTASCPSCGYRHHIVDYLDLTSDLSEERPRNEVINSFRSVAEVLTLFTVILSYRLPPRSAILEKTLFILDGPLLLRANLSRLVEPIRDFLETQKQSGEPIYLVGVEKEGDLRSFTSSVADQLLEPGDFFLPSVKFVVEQISGNRFDPSHYVNRVNFGAKVAARLGRFHTVSINVPTGKFSREPQPEDLIGYRQILSTLSRVLSMSYENALIPLVLINEHASISPEASAGPLQSFVDRLLEGGLL